MMDIILKRMGLSFEKLSTDERASLMEMANQLNRLNIASQEKISIDGIKKVLLGMKKVVEAKLVKVRNNSKKDLFLKARLANYILLENYLFKPEKAKETLDKTLAGMVRSKSTLFSGLVKR